MRWLLLFLIQVLLSGRDVTGLEAELPCDFSCEFTNILAEGEAELDYVLETDVIKYTDAVEQFIEKLPYNQNLSRFDKSWKDSKSQLIPVLVDLPPMGNSSIDNTQLNFIKVVGLLMKKTTEEGKKSLLIECALAAFELRPDTREYELDNEKVYKSLCGTCNQVPELETEGADYAGESWDDVNRRPSRVIASEAEMDYFREDNRLHNFHQEWHRINANRQPRDQASQTERFFYIHKQLLNRYIVERQVARLSRVVPLSSARRSQRFSSRYSINLGNDPYRLLSEYASNRDFCQLSARSRRELNRAEAECNRSIGGRNIAALGRACEENYHNTGHNTIRQDCGTNTRVLTNFGTLSSLDAIMGRPEVSARDPLFYRWHLEVDSKYDQFLARQGAHTLEAVRPPRGITVAQVELRSRCPVNIVETFWETYSYRRNTYYRLNHQPYSVNIRLNNPRQFRGRVIVRLFLFLEEFANSLLYPLEMDRFVQDLRGQATEEFVRRDTQSSLTMQGVDRCGWPRNLLLPKGRTAGFSRFRLAVFVNDISDPRANIGQLPLRGSQVFCGAAAGSRVVGDTRRREGFPFDLRWRFNRGQVINNQHRDFGNITAGIQIHNVGLLDRSGGCMAQL